MTTSDSEGGVADGTPSGPSGRDRTKRLIAFVALVAFVAFGIFYFGPRMPVEAQLRFELPPTVRGGGIELPRARVTRIAAVITDEAGGRVGTVSMALDGAGAPRSAPAVVNLRRGVYAFAVSVSGSPEGEIPMHAVVELSGGENIIDLKAGPRP